ncbi:hypothetical protein [Deinococcus multiflagellatus]|uniref:Uncharacterized protein n=1 Tax=Deinococcus multiflagellatus TaxID=1656887 RepID=A0ABW1ZG69_9DEIO|nr:hypothetical protein [Deinococcus multiflagellatus]MBZ9712206.1 hypothetical protein [Deinococcus multiflagellatus]
MEFVFDPAQGLIITALTNRGTVLPLKGRVRRQIERARRHRRSRRRIQEDFL